MNTETELKLVSADAGRKRERRYGDGSIYRRGRIWHIIYYRNGQKYQESSRSERKRDAEKLLKQRQAAIRLGQFYGPEVGRVTFDEIAEDVLAEYRSLKRRTLRDAEARINLHLKRFFGGRRAMDITNALAQQYVLQRRSQGASDGTIWQELALLRRALRLAVDNRKLREAPRIKLPKLNNVRRGFLEPDQYARLQEVLPDYLRPIAAMAWYTGMRKGEILGLLWNQLVLLDGVLYVRLNPGETKTGKGRVIPLAEEVVRLLEEQRRRHSAEIGCQECTCCTHHVFSRHGRPIRSFCKAWARAREEASVPWLLFHDLRRSAVRNLVRAGIPEAVAMALTGHRTRSVFDRYNIVSERDKVQAMQSLMAYLAKQSVRPRELVGVSVETEALQPAAAA